MTNRVWYLALALGVVLIGSIALERAADAVNPAVGANGIVWSRLASDVCPSGAKTCTRADSSGNFIEKRDDLTGYLVAVSPAPTSGQAIAYNGDGMWTATDDLSLSGSVTTASFVISDFVGHTMTITSIPASTNTFQIPDFPGTSFPVSRLTSGNDVASSGAGAQSTTIASLATPGNGLYRVSIVFSCTTADTVSAQVTYTDPVNSTAQTLTPISSASCGTNGTTSAISTVRATTTTTLLSKISLSSQSTTKASSVIERLF